jgi:hypothetical protein
MTVSEQEAVAIETVEVCMLCGSDRYTTAFEEPPYAVRRCVRC